MKAIIVITITCILFVGCAHRDPKASCNGNKSKVGYSSFTVPCDKPQPINSAVIRT